LPASAVPMVTVSESVRETVPGERTRLRSVGAVVSGAGPETSIPHPMVDGDVLPVRSVITTPASHHVPGREPGAIRSLQVHVPSFTVPDTGAVALHRSVRPAGSLTPGLTLSMPEPASFAWTVKVSVSPTLSSDGVTVSSATNG